MVGAASGPRRDFLFASKEVSPRGQIGVLSCRNRSVVGCAIDPLGSLPESRLLSGEELRQVVPHVVLRRSGCVGLHSGGCVVLL